MFQESDEDDNDMDGVEGGKGYGEEVDEEDEDDDEDMEEAEVGEDEAGEVAEGVKKGRLKTEGLAETRNGNKDRKSGSGGLHPLDIDAHWLQRKLSKYFDDANVSQEKSQDVLQILKNAESDRECENHLVLLLGYDCFDFIKILLKVSLSFSPNCILGRIVFRPKIVSCQVEKQPVLFIALNCYLHLE